MVGRNNDEVKREKSTEKVHKYSIRKFKNGIASAAIGTLLLGAAANVGAVSAEEANPGDEDVAVAQVDEPEVTYGEQVETWPVDFEIEYQETDELPEGEERVVQEGQQGSRQDTVRWTYHDGVPVGSEVIASVVTLDPVNQIIEVGTGIIETSTQEVTWPVDFETEYVETDELPEGEERVIQEGQQGSRVDTVEYTYRDGVPVDSEVIASVVTLEPVNQIIEVGTGIIETSTQEETWPVDFETEYVETDQLPEGEERVIQEGQEGSRVDTVEYTYRDGVPVSSEVIDRVVTLDPVNQIIEVGTGIIETSTQEETWPVDFETEYVETDELLVGEERVIQEGQEGVRRDTVEYTYRDGVPVGSEVIDSVVTLEPVNRIVEVGTVVEETFTQTETWDIDFETEYVETDDLLVGEERVIQEGQTGLREDVVEVTYHDGVPVNSEVLESTVLEDPVNRIVEVGTQAPEEIERYPLAFTVQDLDGRRTSDVTIDVRNEDGSQFTGEFNQYGQWISHGELPYGNYTVTLETPENTYAVVQDTTQQHAVPTDQQNVFTIAINEENIGSLSRIFGSFQLVETPVVEATYIGGIIEVDEDGRAIRTLADFTGEDENAVYYELSDRVGAFLEEGYVVVDNDRQYDETTGSVTQITYVRATEVEDETPEVEATYIGGIIEVDEDGRVLRTLADFTLADENAVYYELSDRLGVLKEQGYEVVDTERQYDETTGSVIWVSHVRLVEEEDETPEVPEEPGDDLQDIIDRIEDLEDRVDELEEENEELRDELARLQEELEKLRDELAAAEDRIDELEDRVDELENRVDDLEDEVEDLEARPTPQDPTDEVPGDDVDEDDQDDQDDQDEDDTDRDAEETPTDPTDVDVEADEDEDEVEDVEVLPQTGVAPSSVGLGIATLLSGLGLGFVGKKRKEDE